jgi:hypothetical protein
MPYKTKEDRNAYMRTFMRNKRKAIKEGISGTNPSNVRPDVKPVSPPIPERAKEFLRFFEVIEDLDPIDITLNGIIPAYIVESDEGTKGYLLYMPMRYKEGSKTISALIGMVPKKYPMGETDFRCFGDTNLSNDEIK